MIPGSYFVLFVVVLLWIYGIPFHKLAKDVGKILTAAFVSLPIGYIISIISQRLYYTPKVSKLNWVNFPSYEKAFNKKRIGNPSLFLNKEELVEAEAAIRGRLLIKDGEVDKRKWFAEWVTKRTDVIAINYSIMFASLIGSFLGLLVLVIPSITPYQEKIFYIPLLLVASFFICWCLDSSIKVLCEQIKHAHDVLYDDLLNSNIKVEI